MTKLTTRDLISMKRRGQKITMITAYDYPTALIADKTGIDVLLVGDSAAMVVLGERDTRFITLEEMLVFSKAVSRAAERALVVGDMPFMSYQVSAEEAVRNAGRFVKEGRVDAVKVEGGEEFSEIISRIVRSGIPVMGHIGVTPQRDVMSTGYRLRGRKVDDLERLLRDALSLERAGAFSIVLEFVTEEAARIITERLSVPVIGVGSGLYCDGQCLVVHDLLGIYPNPPPFSKAYANLSSVMAGAIEKFRDDVISSRFPDESRRFHMDKEELEKVQERLKGLPEV
ncbi:MAG: 3-methyl-2-oxobutanoate hydroxymethyltransferase [Aigarchaeota archaeon]|nr:3-methyl-2-oxobutanoate hydroxymethyltransferase [Aigarchaeota archaeon]MDW8093300.1 3-methyl-2-oxobutanoate hydroxymethyltransferase [Nitrososphaerota archaeon]